MMGEVVSEGLILEGRSVNEKSILDELDLREDGTDRRGWQIGFKHNR